MGDIADWLIEQDIDRHLNPEQYIFKRRNKKPRPKSTDTSKFVHEYDKTTKEKGNGPMDNLSLYYPICDDNVYMINVRFMPSEGALSPTELLEGFGKEYTYKCDLPDVSVGDVVLVEARNWMQAVIVSDVHVDIPIEDTNTKFRWVIGHLASYKERHDERLAKEQQLIRNVKRVRTKHLQSQMLDAIGITQDELSQVLLSNEVVDEGDRS